MPFWNEMLVRYQQGLAQKLLCWVLESCANWSRGLTRPIQFVDMLCSPIGGAGHPSKVVCRKNTIQTPSQPWLRLCFGYYISIVCHCWIKQVWAHKYSHFFVWKKSVCLRYHGLGHGKECDEDCENAFDKSFSRRIVFRQIPLWRNNSVWTK